MMKYFIYFTEIQYKAKMMMIICGNTQRIKIMLNCLMHKQLNHQNHIVFIKRNKK